MHYGLEWDGRSTGSACGSENENKGEDENGCVMYFSLAVGKQSVDWWHERLGMAKSVGRDVGLEVMKRVEHVVNAKKRTGGLLQLMSMNEVLFCSVLFRRARAEGRDGLTEGTEVGVDR